MRIARRGPVRGALLLGSATLLVAAALVGVTMGGAPGRAMASDDSGPAQVVEINPGPIGSGPNDLVQMAGTFYFAAYDNAHASELWASDGTASGTRLVRDINTYQGDDYLRSSYPSDLTVVGDVLFFVADDGVHGFQLWRSDGTEAGTTMLTDIQVHASMEEDNFNPSELTAGDGFLYFIANDGVHGRELWRSDGTVDGTRLLADINPTTTFGRDPGDPQALTEVGKTLFFSGEDAHGRELWASDGTTAGTRMVADINPGGYSSQPAYLTVMGSTLYFSAADPVHSRELWRSDGTTAGTQLVDDISDQTASDDEDYGPEGLTAVGNTLFFSADDGVHGRLLWASDGTAAGTRMLYDGGSESHDAPFPFYDAMTAMGGKLYFDGYDEDHYDPTTHGQSIYTSDGTVAGTRRVAPVPGFFFGSHTAPLVGADRLVYFLNGPDGQLWQTDGTTAGTGMTSGVPLNVSYPNPLITTPGFLYLSFDEDGHGRELWRIPTSNPSTSPIEQSKAPPSVSGSPEVGSELKADPGAWLPSDPVLTYRWVADGAEIDGATESTYRVTSGDVGKQITVRVTASQLGYASATQDSSPTTPVTPRIVDHDRPTVTGRPQVGGLLTANDGSWTPDGLDYSEAWYVGDAGTPAGTARTFVVPASALGRSVTLKVTASGQGMTPVTAASDPTDPVQPGVLQQAGAPHIAGEPRVGSMLRLSPGAVSPPATSTRYQWFRGSRTIPQATHPFYRARKPDRGATLSVRVSYARPGYATRTVMAPRTPRIGP